ncbi:MAG: hypothetical protein HQL69_10820 [Magnetococcales bacterium]|nr:hypothetical protein [Magnetococcales bacterium]
MENTGMERSAALLQQLESRMGALTKMVMTLRDEKAVLDRELAESKKKQAELTQENSDLAAQNTVLQAEKEKTVLKIETLLARFNDYGQ